MTKMTGEELYSIRRKIAYEPPCWSAESPAQQDWWNQLAAALDIPSRLPPEPVPEWEWDDGTLRYNGKAIGICVYRDTKGKSDTVLRMLNSHSDLLKACEEIVARFGGPDIWSGDTKRFFDSVEAAIAKAKGE